MYKSLFSTGATVWWKCEVLLSWFVMNFQCFELAVAPSSGRLAWVYSWSNVAWDWTFSAVFLSPMVQCELFLFLFNLEACIRTIVLCWGHVMLCFVLSSSSLSPLLGLKPTTPDTKNQRLTHWANWLEVGPAV